MPATGNGLLPDDRTFEGPLSTTSLTVSVKCQVLAVTIVVSTVHDQLAPGPVGSRGEPGKEDAMSRPTVMSFVRGTTDERNFMLMDMISDLLVEVEALREA